MRDGGKCIGRTSIRARGRGQSGVTLLEMLVVVAILSIAIITFAVGLQTSTTATADSNIRQKMHLALGSFETAVSTLLSDKANWRPPPACPDANLSNDILTKLDGYSKTTGWSSSWTNQGIKFRVVSVKYWRGGPAFPPVAPATTLATNLEGSFSAGCGAQDQFAQMYTLEVSNSTMSTPLVGSVIVRKPLS